MLRCLLFLLVLQLSLNGCTQSPSTTIKSASQHIGGPCEGCEAIYENKIPFEELNEIDTLPTFHEQGPKLVMSGVVYQSDGKTPAPGVILYVYHTDLLGKYRAMGEEKGWGRRHGSIRGWMKTNAKGEYRFYTIKPASYSQTGPPAHIHITVKEPGKNEYWIDEYQFDNDPFLTEEIRAHQQNRGGNGIIQLAQKNGVFFGLRNIYLGRNIPDYQ